MKNLCTQQNLFKCIVAACFLVLFVWAILLVNGDQPESGITDTAGTEYETARVLEILQDKTTVDETIEGRLRGSMVLRMEILTGRYAGDEVTVTNYFSAMYNVNVAEGDTLSVRIDTTGLKEYQVSIYNYDRIPWIIAMVVLFCLALVVIGGWQGFRALVGLVFTFVCIVWLLLPLALKGYDTVAVTVVIVAITSTLCFYLLGGWQTKIICAALGTLCGVLIAALLGWLAIQVLHVSAYSMDEAEGLILARNDTGLKLNGLLLSGILIAAEGAVMDTAMTVSSAMSELKEKRPDLTARELFRSGMAIGRDATGTMANTLILAFAGASLNMMVLIYSYHVSFIQLMDTDYIAVEVTRAVAGTMGVILTVPCVAAISAGLLAGKSSKAE